MRMPPEILTRILAGEHLNVPTRQALGLWPLETLRYGDVVEHLAQILASRDWFPRSPTAIKPGETIHEGIFVHRESQRRYLYPASLTAGASNRLALPLTRAGLHVPFSTDSYRMRLSLWCSRLFTSVHVLIGFRRLEAELRQALADKAAAEGRAQALNEELTELRREMRQAHEQI